MCSARGPLQIQRRVLRFAFMQGTVAGGLDPWDSRFRRGPGRSLSLPANDHWGPLCCARASLPRRPTAPAPVSLGEVSSPEPVSPGKPSPSGSCSAFKSRLQWHLPARPLLTKPSELATHSPSHHPDLMLSGALFQPRVSSVYCVSGMSTPWGNDRVFLPRSFLRSGA